MTHSVFSTQQTSLHITIASGKAEVLAYIRGGDLLAVETYSPNTLYTVCVHQGCLAPRVDPTQTCISPLITPMLTSSPSALRPTTHRRTSFLPSFLKLYPLCSLLWSVVCAMCVLFLTQALFVFLSSWAGLFQQYLETSWHGWKRISRWPMHRGPQRGPGS